VRFFRLEKRGIRKTALSIMVSPASLIKWNGQFDEQMHPYRIADKRGKSAKVTIEIVRQVVERARRMQSEGRRIRIKGFTRALANEKEIHLSSNTVREILIANDLHAPSTRRRRPRFYQSLKHRIPNGLISVDGSEISIWIDGQRIKFNVEMAVDVGSFCHTAFSLSESETSQEFIKVIEAHRSVWGTPLGVVCDSKSTNLSELSWDYLGSNGIEIVPAGPYNAKGNGTIEGGFSQMKEVIGLIRLDTTSPWALAKSVLAALISVYIKMRNKLPLRRSGITPKSQMKRDSTDKEITAERQRLLDHKKRKSDRGGDQAKIDRLDFLIRNQSMTVSKEVLSRAQKTIKAYELEAIMISEEAFVKAVNRKSERNNLAYFFGILKRVQQERDDQAYANHCRKRYNYEWRLEMERLQNETVNQKKVPEIRNIVGMINHSINGSTRKIRDFASRKVKEWASQINKNVGYTGPITSTDFHGSKSP
jgi:hypothetical protein